MIAYLAALAMLFSTFFIASNAVEDKPVRVTILIRNTTGRPVANEHVRIMRFPEATDALSSCTTGQDGRCEWTLANGVYEVSWNRPLDTWSRVASAENGLHSFGITVGSDPITYHFVLHNDQHIYFDAAPTASLPEPWIPTVDTLFLHEPLDIARTKIGEDTAIVEALPSESVVISEIEVTSSNGHRMRIVLFIELGMLIGLTLYLWSHPSGGISHA